MSSSERWLSEQGHCSNWKKKMDVSCHDASSYSVSREIGSDDAEW